MPNQLGLGNMTGISPQDLNAFQQAFQQVQQVSLQHQLQNYMELMHGNVTSLSQQKSSNSASAQAQAAAQFFQVRNPSNILNLGY